MRSHDEYGWPEKWPKLERLEAALREIDRLQAAISDSLPGLAAIDEGEWREYSGDLVLKEDHWRAICAATKELRIALAGGEARTAVGLRSPYRAKG